MREVEEVDGVDVGHGHAAELDLGGLASAHQEHAVGAIACSKLLHAKLVDQWISASPKIDGCG